MYIVVGLGNPGDEYEETRHNVGRLVLSSFLKTFDFPEMKYEKKYQALSSLGKMGKEKVLVLWPETFMNKSGASVASLVQSKKKAESLIVVHDDLDIPIGKIKISFNRGTGGHRGVLSVAKSAKTEAFVRVRVGVSPTTPSGKIRKPKGDKEVDKFILGKWKSSETLVLKKVARTTSLALESIIREGRELAMNQFN